MSEEVKMMDTGQISIPLWLILGIILGIIWK